MRVCFIQFYYETHVHEWNGCLYIAKKESQLKVVQFFKTSNMPIYSWIVLILSTCEFKTTYNGAMPDQQAHQSTSKDKKPDLIAICLQDFPSAHIYYYVLPCIVSVNMTLDLLIWNWRPCHNIARFISLLYYSKKKFHYGHTNVADLVYWFQPYILLPRTYTVKNFGVHIMILLVQ